MKRILLGFCMASAVSCALFDSGTPWESGPYKLQWIDDPDSVSLLRYQSSDRKLCTELITSQVFSVGINDQYLVAKQHPGGDRRITNFYVVIRSSEKSRRFDPKTLLGPMNATEFAVRSKELNLPQFNKTLAALE